MPVTKSSLPLPSYYYSIIRKLDREVIRTKIVEKISHNDSFNDYANGINLNTQENIHLFLEYAIIFLTIEGNEKIDFNNPDLLALVKETWESTFSKMENKFSDSINVRGTSFENLFSTFSVLQQAGQISYIEATLRLEISLASYRVTYYPVAPPVKHNEVLYSKDSLAFFTPFADMDMDLKLKR